MTYSKNICILQDCFNSLQNLTYNNQISIRKNYILAENSISIEYANSRLYSELHPVISHLESEEKGKNRLDILVLDHSFSPAMSEIQSKLENIGKDLKTEAYMQPIIYHENNRGQLSFTLDAHIQELYYFNHPNSTAIAYFPNSKNTKPLPTGVLASPFRTLFSWYLMKEELTVLHAAAVGNRDGAVLLVGPNGSGKSSTALACFNKGLKFYGDDSVLVSTGKMPQIFSIYRSAKLHSKDLALLKNQLLRVQHNEIGYRNKIQLLVSDPYRKAILTAAPLKAIIIPKFSPTKPTSLQALSSYEALSIVSSSSLAHIPNNRQNALRELRKIVTSAPCYLLFITDRDKIASTIAPLLRQ